MNPITEEKGAMNDMPIENIEVNMESDLKVLPEEPKQKKKAIAPKRSSIEKAVDISLSICDKMEVDEDEQIKSKVISKLIPLLEKEKSKHEDLYLLFRVYDKLQEEVAFNDNSLKNDIKIYKTDFLELKSFLQKKRKPKLDSLELINEAAKEENREACPVDPSMMIVDVIEQAKPVEIKGKKTKKKIKAKKDNKPKEENPLTPHQSNQSLEDINCPNEYLSNEKSLKPSSDKKSANIDKDKQSPDKKKSVDKTNRSIMNFFQPRVKGSISNVKVNLNSNDSYSMGNPSKFETKNNQFPLIYNNNLISYDTSTLPIVTPDPIWSYYSIKGEDITHEGLSDYFSNLGSYFKLMEQHKTGQSERKSNHLKILYIHDSFTPNKNIPDKSSMKMKAKNPFIKVEYIIDYDKDSEEEFMEENAEDIQSNDNSDEDNEEDEDQEINNNDQWIVPDGHFSEDEISEKDVLQERSLFEKYRPKMGSIMDLLEIRKNFSKPIIINFNKKHKELNSKRLSDKLCMKIFHFEDMTIKKTNNNLGLNDNNIPLESTSLSFPIKIECKKTKANGINNSIKNHFNDIINHIHGSFETKEQLIIQLNESHKDISKKGLNTFFKEKCLKLKHNINGKKYWLVKHEILNELNLNQNEIAKLLDNHLNEFNEKERLRLEEREINRQKNQIEQLNSNAIQLGNNATIDNNDNVIMNDGIINNIAENDSNGTSNKFKQGSSDKKRKAKKNKSEMDVELVNNDDFNEEDKEVKEKTLNNAKKRKPKTKTKKNEENKQLNSPIKENKKINELFFNQIS